MDWRDYFTLLIQLLVAGLALGFLAAVVLGAIVRSVISPFMREDKDETLYKSGDGK